jgi:hypothetical protein
MQMERRMSKHDKTRVPSDKDLVLNPMIGGSKGVVMSGASIDDLEELAGENTILGDIENDTTPQGGIAKERRDGRPNRHLGSEKPRHKPLHGKPDDEPPLPLLEDEG